MFGCRATRPHHRRPWCSRGEESPSSGSWHCQGRSGPGLGHPDWSSISVIIIIIIIIIIAIVITWVVLADWWVRRLSSSWAPVPEVVSAGQPEVTGVNIIIIIISSSLSLPWCSGRGLHTPPRGGGGTRIRLRHKKDLIKIKIITNTKFFSRTRKTMFSKMH